jgi:glutathione S-transferase
MDKIKLYGLANSRALRSLWAIEECGVEYEHIPTGFMEEAKTEDYLAINPNGKIPTLVDGDLVLFESMAINLYLARRYATSLYPADRAREALAVQWSIWAISELEPPQMEMVIDMFMTPKEQRSGDTRRRAERKLEGPLAVLDGHLAKNEWLVSEKFSIADLNVAAVMQLLKLVKFDYSDFSHVRKWAALCYSRPAFSRAKTAGSD